MDSLQIERLIVAVNLNTSMIANSLTIAILVVAMLVAIMGYKDGSRR